MPKLAPIVAALVLAAATLLAPAAADAKIKIVAAENFYGDIASQIGGEFVDVVSVISKPDQDPHLFEATPATVRQVADAQIVILNGAHYDEWMEKLLKANPKPGRVAINAGRLVGAKHGGNPHLWYSPTVMPVVAKAIADALVKADPMRSATFNSGLSAVLTSLKRIDGKVTSMKLKYQNVQVAATEPVFGLMAEVLGLVVRNKGFQMALMNETEPKARDIAAFETDLKEKKAKVLIYNTQVSEKLAQRLVDLAKKSNIPVVGVTETMPASVSYQDWMLGQLDALDKALSGS